MAFYLVIDGRKNEFGESDSFVVRAGGKRQAATIAPVIDRKNAQVTKLEDGRDVANGVIHASLVDHVPTPVEVETLVSTDAPQYSVI